MDEVIHENEMPANLLKQKLMNSTQQGHAKK
jgi:hypothetical protein